MLLPIKPICSPKKIRKDGTSPIFLQYCYSATNRTLLNTGINIPPECWNSKLLCITKKLPVAYGCPEQLNAELLRLKRVAEDLATHAVKKQVPDKGNFVKNSFSPAFQISAIEENAEAAIKQKKEEQKFKLDIYYQLDEYIKSKERKVSKATLCVYRNVKAHLLAFQKHREKKITFTSLDFSFYEDFVAYLTFHHVHMRRQTTLVGLKLNTIGKTIKHLRVFIKDREKRKLIPSIDLSDFKIPEEESDAIYLSHEEREEAKHIFMKQFKDRLPKLTNPEFNRHIKTIGKLAGLNQIIRFSHKKGNKDIAVTRPKYEWVTTHTARRSFCTNEFLAGTPVELIISGHKNVKDFYKYIRITQEEAARKIKDLWMGRNDMRLIKDSQKVNKIV